MSARPGLQRGDTLPHIQVTTLDGETFSYTTVWQRKPLVLIVVGHSDADDRYARAVNALSAEFNNHDATCVMTRNAIVGLRTPSVLIADRWGEIVHLVESATSAGLPTPQELIDWLEYLGQRCPECEGEAR